MRIQPKWTASTTMLKKLIVILSIHLLGIDICIASTDEFQLVVIDDPYIEMSTGPGSGYPVFHVMERGESVEIILQRTDWYTVKNDNGMEGRVPFFALSKTISHGGEAVALSALHPADFASSHCEWALSGGEV